MIFKLKRDLESETYTPGKENGFVTYERGKKRRITSLPVRDRVVMHVLSDDIYTPKVTKKIIYDNAASVPGRGIDFARKRFEAHLRKFYMQTGSNKGYILFGDFTKFYDNIDPILAKEQFLELVEQDPYMSYLETAILNNFEKGVSIGNQHSQTIGIYFLHRFDTYIKIVRSQKYYGRYMDDFYIIGESKEELAQLLNALFIETEKLCMKLHKHKTRIVPLDSTYTYLQFRYSLTKTGKIIKRINPKRVTTMRRKLKKLAEKVYAGELPYEQVETMFKSWMGSFYKVMSKEQRLNLIALYEELFDVSISFDKNKMLILHTL